MTFGDNRNDIGMLDIVGKPYIMASAVKNCAATTRFILTVLNSLLGNI